MYSPLETICVGTGERSTSASSARAHCASCCSLSHASSSRDPGTFLGIVTPLWESKPLRVLQPTRAAAATCRGARRSAFWYRRHLLSYAAGPSGGVARISFPGSKNQGQLPQDIAGVGLGDRPGHILGEHEAL